MSLEYTKKLLTDEVKKAEPFNVLIHLLQSVIELLEMPDNDFLWSHWDDADEAVREINQLMTVLRSGKLPAKKDISVLFAPTGALQEVSVSSGWGETFLKIAKMYDEVEDSLWSDE